MVSLCFLFLAHFVTSVKSYIFFIITKTVVMITDIVYSLTHKLCENRIVCAGHDVFDAEQRVERLREGSIADEQLYGTSG